VTAGVLLSLYVLSGGTSYVYDPWGRRIWRQWYDSQHAVTLVEAFFYGATGKVLESYACNYYGANNAQLNCNLEGISTYIAGQMLSEKGVYVATDRLGSVRGDSNGVSMQYYPWGEERTSTADGRTKFAGYYRDMPGQDYAMARYYNANSGSFASWDPSWANAGTATPGSWNRYAYAGGDPINNSDPTGLCTIGGETYPDPCFGTTVGEPTPTGPTPGSPAQGGGSEAPPVDLGGDQNPPGGGSSGPSTPKPPICNSAILQPQYTSVFAQMGKDLGVDPTFIMAISLQESGANLSHVFGTNSSSNNQPLNNLFGSTYGGRDNIGYPSVQASATAWERDWGSYLSDHPTTIQGFVADLLKDPTHMYNVNPDYTVSIVGGIYPVPIKGPHGKLIKSTKGTYPSVKDWIAQCGIKF
jgi:RHS repeat-associated protein